MANLRANRITSTEVFETTGSVQFTNNGGSLTVPDSAIFDIGTDDFTIECFAYLQTIGQFNNIFAVGEDVSDGYRLDISTSNNLRLLAHIGGSWLTVITGGTTLSSSAWYHLAVTRNGDKFDLWVNGVRDTGTVTNSGTITNPTTQLEIGRLSTNSLDRNYSGHISNLRFINGKALYTENFTPPTKELTVTPETVLLACQHKTDASHEKTGQTITVVGVSSAIASELTPGLLTNVVKSGGSSAITGSVDFGSPLENNYLSLVSDSEFTAAGDFTIEAWINLGNNADISPIFNIGDYLGSSGLLFYVTSAGKLASYANNALQHLAGDVSVNSWNHVALVRNGGTVSQYLNGVKTGSYSYSSTLSGFIYIGADYYNSIITHYSNGFTSNLRYVVGTALYTSNFIPPTRNLTKLPGTVLLCCQDNESVTTEATGKTITANGDPTASDFTPQVGSDDSVEFAGPTTINTENYFYLPTGNTEQRGRGRGIFGGGLIDPAYVNTIQYITISSTGNAIDFGDLLSVRAFAGACASSTRGVFLGGGSPAQLDNIEYVTISSTGNSQDFGDLINGGRAEGSTSNSTRGLRLASTQVPAVNNTIEYITIASTGNAIDFGDTTQARTQTSALASPTRGIHIGGYPNTNIIDFVTIASTGNAQDFGDCSAGAQAGSGACSSPTRGLFAGGSAPTPWVSRIDYLTIASTGNSQNFGSLSVGTRKYGGTCSSPTRGIFGIGEAPAPIGFVNTLEYVTIASTGDSQDFGDLLGSGTGSWGSATTSDAHGGLG